MAEFGVEHTAETLIETPSSNENATAFIKSILDDEGVFSAQENTLFDYKLEFPHSMTDPYFAAICRLLLSFFNSFGGVAILGVHDEDRTSGHNKKFIKIEPLNTRLRELCGQSVNVQHARVEFDKIKVDLLIVPRRPVNQPPAVLKVDLDKYEQGTIWLRRGHETLEATSRDIPFLFGPRELSADEVSHKIASFLPPSPSTIGKFVGRVDILSRLLSWISNEDEPRMFVYGRGGSGKSTVAHEFAQLIRDNGRIIETFDSTMFDRVIYLSAKEKELNIKQIQIQDTISADFSNFDELLAGILIGSEYSDVEEFSQLKRDALIDRVKEVFDHENLLVVVDDIDTLTTKGEDAGFDALYKMSLRAKSTIRLLYTQRNPPTASENEVQVSGFVVKKEFREFVHNCCKQFDVQEPNESYLIGELKETTEAIPLIIETIIRLRKSCGNYETAHAIFMERRGEEARRYLFEREYDSLPSNNNARHVLATIAEFGSPVGNEEIGSIVSIGESAIAESIGQVIGFFLSTVVSAEGETKYFLNPVTRTYIRRKVGDLSFGEKIKERVRAFKSAGQSKPKAVVIIEKNISGLLARGRLDEAREVVSRQHPAKVSENPTFRMMRASVFASLNPPLLIEAREDFQYCVDKQYENAEAMRRWLNLEKRHGGSTSNQTKICDLVINGRSYADTVRNEFRSRKAVAVFFGAKERGGVDAYGPLVEALKLHVAVYNFFWNNGYDTNRHHKNVRNTAFEVVNVGRSLDYDKELVKVFRDICKDCGSLCEPLADPLLEVMSILKDKRGGDAGRRRQGVSQNLLQDFGSGKLKFDTEEANIRFRSRISDSS